MSRRPANVTEADVTRVLRAAQQAGPNWRVEIKGKVLRLVQSPPLTTSDLAATPQASIAPEAKWQL